MGYGFCCGVGVFKFFLFFVFGFVWRRDIYIIIYIFGGDLVRAVACIYLGGVSGWGWSFGFFSCIVSILVFKCVVGYWFCGFFVFVRVVRDGFGVF